MWFCRMVEAGHTEAPAKLLEVAIEHRLERYRYYLKLIPTQYSLFFFRGTLASDNPNSTA